MNEGYLIRFGCPIGLFDIYSEEEIHNGIQIRKARKEGEKGLYLLYFFPERFIGFGPIQSYFKWSQNNSHENVLLCEECFRDSSSIIVTKCPIQGFSNYFKIEERHALNFLSQITEGLRFLYRNPSPTEQWAVFDSIKPQCLMVFEDSQVQVSDFYLKKTRGSPHQVSNYTAPEVSFNHFTKLMGGLNAGHSFEFF